MTISLCEIGTASSAAYGQSLRSRVVAWIRGLESAERARRELNAMTDVELKDMGLTRGQIGAVENGTFSR